MTKVAPLLLAAVLVSPLFSQGTMAPPTEPAQAEKMPKPKMMKKKPMHKDMKKKDMEPPPAQP